MHCYIAYAHLASQPQEVATNGQAQQFTTIRSSLMQFTIMFIPFSAWYTQQGQTMAHGKNGLTSDATVVKL